MLNTDPPNLQAILHGIHGLDKDLWPLVHLACILGVINIYLWLEVHTGLMLAATKRHISALWHLIQQPLIPPSMLELWLINEGMWTRGANQQKSWKFPKFHLLSHAFDGISEKVSLKIITQNLMGMNMEKLELHFRGGIRKMLQHR